MNPIKLSSQRDCPDYKFSHIQAIRKTFTEESEPLLTREGLTIYTQLSARSEMQAFLPEELYIEASDTEIHFSCHEIGLIGTHLIDLFPGIFPTASTIISRMLTYLNQLTGTPWSENGEGYLQTLTEKNIPLEVTYVNGMMTLKYPKLVYTQLWFQQHGGYPTVELEDKDFEIPFRSYTGTKAIDSNGNVSYSNLNEINSQLHLLFPPQLLKYFIMHNNQLIIPIKYVPILEDYLTELFPLIYPTVQFINLKLADYLNTLESWEWDPMDDISKYGIFLSTPEPPAEFSLCEQQLIKILREALEVSESEARHYYHFDSNYFYLGSYVNILYKRLWNPLKNKLYQQNRDQPIINQHLDLCIPIPDIRNIITEFNVNPYIPEEILLH